MTLRLSAGLVVALAVAGSAAAGAVAPTGLFGHFRRGPITPVCRVGVPCDAPLPGILVFTRGGRSWRAQARADGGYRIELPAGSYRVSTTFRQGIRPALIRPGQVRVLAGRLTRVDFLLDTGIR